MDIIYFIYGLFLDAVTSLNLTASYDMMMRHVSDMHSELLLPCVFL
jgi:hypothetical protein